MARRHGFFAELQRRVKLAEQEQQLASRERTPAMERAEAAQRAAQDAQAAADRARGKARQRLQRQAAQAHVAARQAEVDQMTAALQEKYALLDGILAAALQDHDFVNLESLRAVAEHPPFPRDDLRVPIPHPAPIPEPPRAVKREPRLPKSPFGRKEKTAEAIAAAEQQYAADYSAWKVAADGLPARRAAQDAMHATAERARRHALSKAVAQYEAECSAREKKIAEQNASLDQLIAGVDLGTPESVQEYVAIVLASAVYPDWFPVSRSATFDQATAVLSLQVSIPGPDAIPTVKGYRYIKPTDEIVPVEATHEETKDRYTGIVHHVALRSLHEIFHADREGVINSISLDLGTETVSRATGQPTYVQLVAVACTRAEFERIDLSAVFPAATLEHLGATLAKDPKALVALVTDGVRRAD